MLNHILIVITISDSHDLLSIIVSNIFALVIYPELFLFFFNLAFALYRIGKKPLEAFMVAAKFPEFKSSSLFSSVCFPPLSRLQCLCNHYCVALVY